jgi:hypothetical protein
MKLGLERLIDDLGKLGVFEHLDPDPDDPIPRIVAHTVAL